jgi:S-adenosylmethionine:tRNA ribosyltransferase-isomerase
VLTRDFDYQLPADAIAQHPAPRGESRLLALDLQGEERHRRVADLPALLRRGDLLVVNDTRVLPARLFGRLAGREGRARVELLLVERLGEREWEVLARPGRRARAGAVIELDAGPGARAGGGAGPGARAGGGTGPGSGPDAGGGPGPGSGSDAGGGAGPGSGPGSGTAILVEVTGLAGDGRRRVRFSEPIEPHLERLGHVPLPPYIRRPDEPADRERYQTVFARRPGAIAAPTAGLHFSAGLLAALAAAGVERAALTLHVGIGTFKPVTAPLVSDHRMDRERYEIPAETAAAVARARSEGRRVVAVGTTVVRALEGAAAAGGRGEVAAGAGSTDLFIAPGFRFRAVDVLLTNFHLPRSTLLMLVSAFAGRERVLAAYQEALGRGYRFFSYGDAMLAERRPDVAS